MKLVTIIIPAYNAEKTIKKCINSCTLQTYRNIEVIVVDDGSDDNTYQVCKELHENDSRITVYTQINSGPSVARNLGIERSRGDYIMFVDADDWIEQECIASAIEKIEQSNSDIVLWNALLEKNGSTRRITPLKGNNRFFENNQIISLVGMVLANESENQHCSNICITGPVCKLFKKEFIGNNRFPNTLSIGEDFVFLLQLLGKNARIFYIDEYYYHIEYRANSLSHGFDLCFAKRKMEYVNYVIEIVASDSELEKSLDKFVYYNYLTVVEKYLFTRNIKTFKDRKKYIEIFINGVNRRIDYSNISHKCCWFLKNRVYLPIYVLGLISGRYR